MPDAGTIGDIFASAVKALGGAGVITDGALRDTPTIQAIDLPVYHQSSHASTYGRQHMPYSVDDSITCAGVFVQPGDIVVGDAEGAVVIPTRSSPRVAATAVAQEEVEEFAIERVAAGESTDDVFPLSTARRRSSSSGREARRGSAPDRSTSTGSAICTAIPVASRIGPLLMSSVIAPFDPAARRAPTPSTRRSTTCSPTFASMLDRGASWNDVVKMNFWVPGADHRSALEAPWLEHFPDETPGPPATPRCVIDHDVPPRTSPRT